MIGFHARTGFYKDDVWNIRSLALIVDNPCSIAVLDLSAIQAAHFTSTIKYEIRSAAVNINLDPTLVTSSETLVTCPSIMFEIVNADSTAVDTSIFSYQEPTFSIESHDILSVPVTYPLTLRGFYQGLATTTTSEFAFNVELIDSCALATLNLSSLVAATFSSLISYNIKYTAMVIFIDPGLVTSSESVVTCPAITFEVTKADSSLLDSAIFQFSDLLNELQIYTDDPSTEATYNLKLTAFY